MPIEGPSGNAPPSPSRRPPPPPSPIQPCTHPWFDPSPSLIHSVALQQTTDRAAAPVPQPCHPCRPQSQHRDVAPLPWSLSRAAPVILNRDSAAAPVILNRNAVTFVHDHATAPVLLPLNRAVLSAAPVLLLLKRTLQPVPSRSPAQGSTSPSCLYY